jgi:hypothetical protein
MALISQNPQQKTQFCTVKVLKPAPIPYSHSQHNMWRFMLDTPHRGLYFNAVVGGCHVINNSN